MTQDGLSAAVLYLAAYLFMNLGAFSCVILFSLRTGSDRILDYSGLYQKDPLITLGLSLCLLSLGGKPPSDRRQRLKPKVMRGSFW